jgi:tetratricopeptide (TPR) repeat protein
MSLSIASSIPLSRLLEFLELDPGNLALRRDAIEKAFGADRLDLADELIGAGLAAHPDEPTLLALSGLVHLQAQRYADAEHAFAGALARGIEAAEVSYNLACALFMQRRYSEALDLLQAPAVAQAVQAAALLRIRCLHHLVRAEEAMAGCRTLLQLTPQDAETNGLLALMLYESGRLELAREHVRVALEQDSKQLEALLALASMQADAQEYVAARVSLNTLLQAHPQCGRGWLQWALIELSHMKLELAKQYIERAAAYLPGHIGTWHVLAWIHILLGDDLTAQAAFESALALDRNFAETHGGLAVLAARQGREDQARSSIKRALRLDSQCMSAACAQMVLMQREGQHKQAEALLASVLARPVASGDMQYRDLVIAQMLYLHTSNPEEQSLPRHH